MKSNSRTFLQLIAVAILALSSFSLSGCNSGGTVYYDPYEPMWYDVYGHYCGSTPGPGCNYYADGVKIIDVEDPYFTSYNYNLQFATWEYVDTYGFLKYFTGWAWLSPSNILYDEYGYALNETGGSTDRDIISQAAEKELKAVEGAGKEFAARYLLAEDVGIRVARSLNDWATISKSRSRTEKDKADFSKRLYGVDFNKVTVALTKAQAGDKTLMNETLGEVARFWGTTPESSREILKNAYKHYLGDVSLD